MVKGSGFRNPDVADSPAWVRRFYLTQCIDEMVLESHPPPNRQLIVQYYQLKQYVDDFVEELTV